jgi:hypothetical protein
MNEIQYHLDTFHDVASVGNFRLLGFGTGSYYNKCHNCGIVYMGDKLSATCLKCAIRIAEDCVVRCAQIDMNGDGLLDHDTEARMSAPNFNEKGEEI